MKLEKLPVCINFILSICEHSTDVQFNLGTTEMKKALIKTNHIDDSQKYFDGGDKCYNYLNQFCRFIIS